MYQSVGPIAALIFAVFVTGYIVQSRLPPPKPRIIGIDLGTTFSCVGVYQAVSGNVTVISDEDGKVLIPSVVTFMDSDIFVGNKAVSLSETYPRRTVYDSKRFIGKPLTDDDLVRASSIYPFKMTKDASAKCRYEIISSGKNLSIFYPEDIAAFIIRKLKTAAEKYLHVKVDKAVISVPADFNAAQRNATKEAGRKAGVKVLRIINEPTAAAMAYGLHKKHGIRSVIVVDFGGGTLDVSLLSIQGGMFVTIAMAGNNRLGGQDFNVKMINHLQLQIKKKLGMEITTPADIQKLRAEVESAKINLTYSMSAHIKLDITGEQTNAKQSHFEYDITRELFEDVNSELFVKILEPIKVVLTQGELSPSDIDDIVLVGGSTRIPKVRKVIQEFFGKNLNVAVNPDTAVVTGVSIQAGILGGAWPLQVAAIELPQNNLRKIEINP